ncbi:MAG: hypothetical protein QG621_453 [Patescibacteria group bacterium]|jgi:hypothetical protein|nr:hypothetical protein [Patescibacteria group bacterium]
MSNTFGIFRNKLVLLLSFVAILFLLFAIAAWMGEKRRVANYTPVIWSSPTQGIEMIPEGVWYVDLAAKKYHVLNGESIYWLVVHKITSTVVGPVHSAQNEVLYWAPRTPGNELPLEGGYQIKVTADGVKRL